jgi:hypothetical protein
MLRNHNLCHSSGLRSSYHAKLRASETQTLHDSCGMIKIFVGTALDLLRLKLDSTENSRSGNEHVLRHNDTSVAKTA